MLDTASRHMNLDPSRWLRRRSVKSRVTISATAMLTLTLVIAALSLTGLEKRSLIREIDSGLDDRISGLIDNAVNGQLSVDVPLTGRESGIVQILDNNATVIAATPNLHDKAFLNAFTPGTRGPVHRAVDRAIGTSAVETWRIAGQRIGSAPDTVDIFAATSLDSVNNAATRLRDILLAGVLILVAIFAVISWLTTRWSLAPVATLTTRVDTMSVSDLRQRLPEPTSHDEIGHLVNTMNAMLGRLAEARERERRFAADASHELRTPLTTARLNLEIALANPSSENLRGAVDETLVEIGRLEILARDLLELTRLDAVRVRANSKNVDMAELIRKELSIRTRVQPELNFATSISEPLVVSGVAPLLTRVVRNLVDNAVLHAVSNIRIETTTAAEWATIRVHNDGPPIPDEDRVRIFAPFTRLDNARSRDDGGTGLGLAIAADIVEAHGGEIAVVDDHNAGATFRFTLPLAHPSAPIAPTPRSPNS